MGTSLLFCSSKAASSWTVFVNQVLNFISKMDEQNTLYLPYTDILPHTQNYIHKDSWHSCYFSTLCPYWISLSVSYLLTCGMKWFSSLWLTVHVLQTTYGLSWELDKLKHVGGAPSLDATTERSLNKCLRNMNVLNTYAKGQCKSTNILENNLKDRKPN
jgi:hypothetical protein